MLLRCTANQTQINRSNQTRCCSDALQTKRKSTHTQTSRPLDFVSPKLLRCVKIRNPPPPESSQLLKSRPLIKRAQSCRLLAVDQTSNADPVEEHENPQGQQCMEIHGAVHALDDCWRLQLASPLICSFPPWRKGVAPTQRIHLV